jgi:hypothetical protein
MQTPGSDATTAGAPGAPPAALTLSKEASDRKIAAYAANDTFTRIKLTFRNSFHHPSAKRSIASAAGQVLDIGVEFSEKNPPAQPTAQSVSTQGKLH